MLSDLIALPRTLPMPHARRMPHDPLAWIDQELAQLEARTLRRRLAMREGPQRASVRVGDAELVNFGANDYLGLAADERVTRAAAEAAIHCGWGSGASPLVTGRGSWHARLEAELAQFEGTDAALLFPAGYAANVGAITSLAGKGDVIFSDARNHASIIDGCRLSGAGVVVYPHRDVDDLQAALAQAGGYRRRLIVTDSLFSMDGCLAPLPDLADLAEMHDAMLMVDEAHATGVFGASGRGVSEKLGVEEGVHVRVGTLSKALGSIGGFVSGKAPLIDWLANRARPYVYSTAMPEAAAAAASAALKIVVEEPHRRRELLERAARLAQRLIDQGWNVASAESQILPVVIGEADRTMNLAAALRERGLLVPGIRPPSVPEGQSLLRISLCYGHGDDEIERLVGEMGRVRAT